MLVYENRKGVQCKFDYAWLLASVNRFKSGKRPQFQKSNFLSLSHVTECVWSHSSHRVIRCREVTRIDSDAFKSTFWLTLTALQSITSSKCTTTMSAQNEEDVAFDTVSDQDESEIDWEEVAVPSAQDQPEHSDLGEGPSTKPDLEITLSARKPLGKSSPK